MKSPEYFITKAEELKQQIDSAVKNEEFLNYSDALNLGEGSNKEKYTSDQNEADTMKTKVNLIVREFDNSIPFTERIDALNSSRSYSFSNEKDRLSKFSSILELFVSHIKDWRQEAEKQ